MKAGVQPIAAATYVEKTWASVLGELFKLRLTLLVLLTTLVGFYLGTVGSINYALMAHTVFATALLACGAAALNQLWERDHDAKMRRTEDRPLPSGRMRPDTVLVVGGFMSMAGLLYLSIAVNLLASFLGGMTLVIYLFVYTPMKRVTWLNTTIGAIPGALPPLIGWAAARNELSSEAVALFAILFFWQIPHFLAIAWIYRDEYAKAGFVMLPNVDPQGFRTSRQAVSHTFGLVLVSLWPVVFGVTGIVYMAGAVLLGAIFLVAAFRFSRSLTLHTARQLFFASILYLPLLLGLMVIDKIRV
jgi:protoheme IX farnesyltransferase